MRTTCSPGRSVYRIHRETQRERQASRVRAPSMKAPIDTGYSLRAETRRLRAEQCNMLKSIDDLI